MTDIKKSNYKNHLSTISMIAGLYLLGTFPGAAYLVKESNKKSEAEENIRVFEAKTDSLNNILQNNPDKSIISRIQKEQSIYNWDIQEQKQIIKISNELSPLFKTRMYQSWYGYIMLDKDLKSQ